MMNDLKFYEINREGWLGVCGSLAEKNAKLEWLDVKEGHYIVIDSDGWIYDAREDEESRWGYRWKRSDRQSIDIKMMLAEHVDGEKLSVDELNFCK